MGAASTLDQAFKQWLAGRRGPGRFLIGALRADGYVIVPADFLQRIGEEIDLSLERSQTSERALYAYNTLGVRIAALLNAVNEER
jgi:hypothetical protein